MWVAMDLKAARKTDRKCAQPVVHIPLLGS